jgi:ribosomal protein S11
MYTKFNTSKVDFKFDKSKVYSFKDKKLGKFRRRRIPKPLPKLYIRSNSKTLFVTFLNPAGRVLLTFTPGMFSFKGPRRATMVSVAVIAKRAALKIKQLGYKFISLTIQMRKRFLVSSLISILGRNGIRVVRIEEDLLIAHNGCRAKKIRRL